MFNDSLISLMVMLLLCFMGMLVMFLFVIRSLSVQTAALREGFTRQQSTLADLEQQIMDMNFALRRMQRDSGPPPVPDGHDILAAAAAGSPPAGDIPPAVANPATDYSYPSAAGFGALEEDSYDITLFPGSSGREKKEKQPPVGLDLKMGN